MNILSAIGGIFVVIILSALVGFGWYTLLEYKWARVLASALLVIDALRAFFELITK